MKASILSLALLCSSLASHGQGSFSADEALKQLYRDYNPATKTAQWVCTKEQKAKGMHSGWPCVKEDETVSVSVILMAQVREGDAVRTYFASSAKPAYDPEGEYNCHGCAPAIGAAVFVWQGQRWIMESANAAVGFWSGWGEPPTIELIAVGPERHGLLLSYNDEGQGFSSSLKRLVIPAGKSVEVIWSIEDESDDAGAVDPDGRQNRPPLYSSSAAFRLLTAADGAVNPGGYYDIEVTSSGTSWDGPGHPVGPENWVEVYRFNDGKYKLLRKTELSLPKGLGKAASQ